jgi:hypothetical protein
MNSFSETIWGFYKYKCTVLPKQVSNETTLALFYNYQWIVFFITGFIWNNTKRYSFSSCSDVTKWVLFIKYKLLFFYVSMKPTSPFSFACWYYLIANIISKMQTSRLWTSTIFKPKILISNNHQQLKNRNFKYWKVWNETLLGDT